jgi:branched-subunit amino acid transport protein
MSASELLLVASMALVTFAVRYPVLAFVSRAPLPPRVQEALHYIPPAVLAAIIAPAILMPGGKLDLTYTNAYLVAALVAVIVSWATRNLLLTILLGMAALWLWRWLVSPA